MFGFEKGKMDIQLNKFNFNAGETIDGQLSLTLKKQVDAKELSVKIYAIKKTVQMTGNSRSTNTVKVFEFKQPLQGAKSMTPTSVPLVVPFKITTPQNIQGKTPQGALGTAINAIQMLGGSTSNMQWYIEGRLSIPGFDITKKVQVNAV